MANNITVLNTIWENASEDYQARIPEATRDNIAQVGNAILTYDVTKNEFLNALVNRISLVLVSSKMARNRLAKFKKGMLEYGQDVEEIFTEMAKAHTYDIEVAENEVFKREIPDTKAIFHRINREDFYKVTIQEVQLRRAFLSSDGLGKLVVSIMNSMYSGDNHDEYILMKQLMADYEDNYAVIETPKVTDKESAMDLFRAIKQTSTDFTFVSDQFNAQGVQTFTDKSDQVLLVHKNVDTFMDTDVLAWVFNTNKIDPAIQKIVVDDFGTMGDTQALLVDKDWFMVWDTNFKTTSQYNGQGDYWNYWLHHHQILSTSQFQNAVRFKIATDETGE